MSEKSGTDSIKNDRENSHTSHFNKVNHYNKNWKSVVSRTVVHISSFLSQLLHYGEWVFCVSKLKKVNIR